MRTKRDVKLHYKMYKHGKLWLFAGIALLAVQGQQLLAQADTGAKPAAKAPVVENVPVPKPEKQVVIQPKETSSSSNVTRASSNASPSVSQSSSVLSAASSSVSTSTASSSISAVSQPASSHSQASAKNDSQSSETQASTAKPAISETAVTKVKQSSVVVSTETNSSQYKPVIADKATQKPIITPAKQPETNHSKPTDTIQAAIAPSTVGPADNVGVTTSQISATSQAPVVTSLKPVIKPKDSPTPAELQRSNELTPQATVRDIAPKSTGTLGDVSWNFDEGTGALSVGGGNLPYSTSAIPIDLTAVKTMAITDKLKLASAPGEIFKDMPNVTSISGLENLDTSAVTDMSFMFANDPSLKSLDLSGFDTHNVTGLFGTFVNDAALESLIVTGPNWDTSKVTTMYNTFYELKNLKELDLSGWQTKNVTAFTTMFKGDRSLTQLNVAGFNTESATDLSGMFDGVSAVQALDVSGFQTGKVTNMQYLFNNVQQVQQLDLSKWDTSQVTTMFGMFLNMANLSNLDLSDSFNTQNVTNMGAMFAGDKSLKALDLSHFDTTKVTTMDNLLTGTSSLTAIDVSHFDTSHTTSMASMFASMSNLTSLDLSHFDTSQVTSMTNMFSGMANLTTLDLSRFDTSRVTDMSSMFNSMDKLQSLDLSHFDTSNVTNMAFMISADAALTALDLSSFSTKAETTQVNLLLNLPKLRVLVLGKGMTNLTDTSLSDPVTRGHWQNVGTGTIADPTGQYDYDSVGLVANFDGPTMGDTYVWILRLTPQTEKRVYQRTIAYQDAESHADLATPIIQTVAYQRVALIDQYTGDLLGYDTTGDGQIDTTNADSAWFLNGTSATLAAVTSPDFTINGYQGPSQAKVAAKVLSAADITDGTVEPIVITYVHATAPILNYRAIQRTINFVDGETQADIQDGPISQIVQQAQTAIIDQVTGQVLGYDTTGDGQIDTQDANAAWVVVGDNTLAAVTSPDYRHLGYLSPSQAGAAAIVIDSTYTGALTIPVVITYAHATKAQVSQRTLQRTINYLDAESGEGLQPAINQKVSYAQTALVDQVTGNVLGYDTTGDGQADTADRDSAWVVSPAGDILAAVVSPDFGKLGYQAPMPAMVAEKAIDAQAAAGDDILVTVRYAHRTRSNRQVKTVTRTVHYLDAVSKAALQSPVVQTVSHQRQAIIDLVTGQLLGYDLTGDGVADTTDGDSAWTPVSTTVLPTVASPDFSAQGYLPASQLVVPSQTITSDYAGDPNLILTVTYAHDTRTAAEQRQIKRTITYVDRQTHGTVAPAVAQSVAQTRTSVFDAVTGQLLGYDLTGDGAVDTQDATHAWLAVGSESLAAVTSPDLTSHGYTTASMSQVAAQVIGSDYAGALLIPVEVHYGHATKTAQQTQHLQRTIHYLDAETLAALVHPNVQAVSYHLTEVVDAVNGQVLGYDTTGDGQVDTQDAEIAWRVAGSDTFTAVTSPDLQQLGYHAPSVAKVTAQAVSAADAAGQDIVLNVTYAHQLGTATNVKTVVRTIRYLTKDSHQVLAVPVVQRVSYLRTGIVDQVTQELLGYDTTGDGKVDTTDATKAWIVGGQGNQTLAAVTSPNLTKLGYERPSLVVVPAKFVSADYAGSFDLEVPVYYQLAATLPSEPDTETPDVVNPEKPDVINPDQPNVGQPDLPGTNLVTGKQQRPADLKPVSAPAPLPQTGEQPSLLSTVAGFLLLGLLGFEAVQTKRKQQH